MSIVYKPKIGRYPFLALLSEGELEKFSSCEEISESEGNIINSDTEWEVTGKYFLFFKPSQQSRQKKTLNYISISIPSLMYNERVS